LKIHRLNFFHSLLFLLLTFGLLTSCQQEVKNNSSVSIKPSNNIYGDNDRIKVKNVSGPLSKIGKLLKPNHQGSCTASLIGKNLILTAAHCIFKASSGVEESPELLTGSYLFQLGLKDGVPIASSGISHFWWGGLDFRKNKINDWAILELKKPLGKTYGYLGTKSIKEQSEHNFNVRIAGYSTIAPDLMSLYEQEGCRIRIHNQENKLLFHDCDAGPGDSGAPIFKCIEDSGCYILGIHVSSEVDNDDLLKGYSELEEFDYGRHRNIGASSINFFKKLVELQKNSL